MEGEYCDRSTPVMQPTVLRLPHTHRFLIEHLQIIATGYLPVSLLGYLG